MVASPSSEIEFLRRLRQIRQLRPDALPTAALDDILEVARWTGSARNLQPWDFILVQDRSVLQALGTIEGGRGPHLVNAGAAIALVLSGEADHWDWDAYDEGRLSERIMLAAAAHGIGSAIGWFKDSAADEAKRMLGVPSERLLRSVISLGLIDDEAYARRNRPEQPRKPMPEVLHRERW